MADYEDFGVGGRVTIADSTVTGTREDFAIMDDEGADGDFAGSSCGAGFLDGHVHEGNVSVHDEREDSTRKAKESNKASRRREPQVMARATQIETFAVSRSGIWDAENVEKT